MKVRQLTIPGDGLVRIRVISWDEGEVGLVQSHRAEVPDLYWDDTPERKILRRYRIKQVMGDGSESPWVLQRRVAIKAGYGKTVRLRMRPVSVTGQLGHWQYTSISTGASDHEPGERLLDAFVSDLIDLVIDAFVDSVFLSVNAEDQVSHRAFDDFPTFDAFANLIETLPQDDMEVVLESVRGLSKKIFRENFSSMGLVERTQSVLLLHAPSDQWAREAIYSASMFLLEAFAHDAWESALRETISVFTEDGSLGSAHDRYDKLIRDGSSFFAEFLRKDQLSYQVFDTLGAYVFPNYADVILFSTRDSVRSRPLSDHAHAHDTVSLGFLDIIGAVRSLNHVLSSDQLIAEIQPKGAWTVRPYLIDYLLLPILDWLRGFDIDVKLADRFIPLNYETLQAVLDDPSGWIADHFDLSLKDTSAADLSVEKFDQVLVPPRGDPYFSYIIFAKEFIHRLGDFQAAARLLYADLPHSFKENLPISLPYNPPIRQSSFQLEDVVALKPESGSDHWLRISGASLHSRILERVAEDVSAILDPHFGASETAFIMGQFIMGVTPMGRT